MITSQENPRNKELNFLTWNLEGLKRNYLNLKHIMRTNKVDIAFLSEPKVFSHDAHKLMQHLSPDYSYYLNSDDKHDPDLPLSRS